MAHLTVQQRNPFYFGGKITDPSRFIGRQEELRAVIQRMDGAQMQSVCVVGEPRIGKSSLLYHIYQTYAQRVAAPQCFLVTYISLQGAHVRTQSGLLNAMTNGLQKALDNHLNVSALPAWPELCDDLVTFGDCLRTMADADLRCVVCLDEFEALLDNPREFDDRLYDGLRALMDDQLLMLVIASHKSLIYYGSRYRLVSRFFNLGYTLPLGDLTEEDARALLLRVRKNITSCTHQVGSGFDRG